MEHHLSLSLANKAIKTARAGDAAAMKQLGREIAADFPTRWDTHFKNEETTIFTMLDALDDGPTDMTATLRQQHDEMRSMATALGHGDISVLEAFGTLLRDHTRMEERELFPIAEARLSEEQLNKVLEATQATGS
jgi:hemerythrin-like domain-containing protein